MVSDRQSGRLLVTVVDLFELGRRHVAKLTMEPFVVPPSDPGGCRKLEVGAAPPRSVLPDALELETGVDRLGHGIVVGVAARSDRDDSALVGEPLGIADGQILAPAVGIKRNSA